MSVEEIEQEAMALPDLDRAHLADRLLASLPDRYEPEFLAELDRRMEDLDSGKAKAVPGNEVLAMIRKKYGHDV